MKPTLEKTLKILQLDYVDLYIIELPMAFKVKGRVVLECLLVSVNVSQEKFEPSVDIYRLSPPLQLFCMYWFAEDCHLT